MNKEEIVVVATCTNRKQHKRGMIQAQIKGNPADCPHCKHALFYERILVKRRSNVKVAKLA